MKHHLKIKEGLSNTVAKATALAIKRKVILTGRRVRSEKEIEAKLNLLSIQLSTLSAMVMLSISLSGDGLLNKAGIISGLFTEEFPNA